MSRVLVLGGARSGKSMYAQSLLTGLPNVRYVATGYPPGADPEWAARVRAHQARRPQEWVSVETVDLLPLLAEPHGALLIDCISLWLTRRMDESGAWELSTPPPQLRRHVDALVSAWEHSACTTVAVSSEVGSGVVPMTPAGIRFRDELGSLNRRLAAASDTVWLVVAGLPLRLK